MLCGMWLQPVMTRGSSCVPIASVRRKAARLVPVLLDWFARNARDLPWRRTRDPYAIWVSEIMLQQTQVRTVTPYYQRWMRSLPDIRALSRASSEKLHKLWEGLGYYTRVRNMQTAAKIICREHGGRLPEQFERVLALPGIGRYTAGAICSIAFNQPTPVLDGNVTRVLTRLFGIATDPKNPETNAALWQLAEVLVRQSATMDRLSANGERLPAPCSSLNQSLMELGATVCTPRKPQCSACPVRRSCIAQREGLTGELPATASRPAITHQHRMVFAIQNRSHVWLVRKPERNADSGLWEFPGLEVKDKRNSPSYIAARVLPFRASRFSRLTTFQHNITRYNVTFEAFTGMTDNPDDAKDGVGRWVPLSRLRSLPLPAAHRRIASLL